MKKTVKFWRMISILPHRFFSSIPENIPALKWVALYRRQRRKPASIVFGGTFVEVKNFHGKHPISSTDVTGQGQVQTCRGACAVSMSLVRHPMGCSGEACWEPHTAHLLDMTYLCMKTEHKQCDREVSLQSLLSHGAVRNNSISNREQPPDNSLKD